jgi:hypothetical protein
VRIGTDGSPVRAGAVGAARSARSFGRGRSARRSLGRPYLRPDARIELVGGGAPPTGDHIHQCDVPELLDPVAPLAVVTPVLIGVAERCVQLGAVHGQIEQRIHRTPGDLVAVHDQAVGSAVQVVALQDSSRVQVGSGIIGRPNAITPELFASCEQCVGSIRRAKMADWPVGHICRISKMDSTALAFVREPFSRMRRPLPLRPLQTSEPLSLKGILDPDVPRRIVRPGG